MSEASRSGFVVPFESAGELNAANSQLVARLEALLGPRAHRKDEPAALAQLAPQIREFLARGIATGRVIEDIEERTACQVLVDYWTTSLARTGIEIERRRLDDFDVAALPLIEEKDRPFVGLDAYRDQRLFFGRDKAVQSLVERIEATPLVVVQGASGSGKSSLVMGGALPRLCADDHPPRFRLVGPFAPGNAVLDHLAAAFSATRPGAPLDVPSEVAALRGDAAHLSALAAAADTRPLLVVIDQFEEVFTLPSPEGDLDALARNLAHLLDERSDHRVVLTMRGEFSNDLDLLAPLAGYLKEARHARFSMKEWHMGYEDLKAAVEEPAKQVNLQFAPGVVDELVKSVLRSGDTALPLLQFMLERLWEQRDRNRITHAVFDRVRGVPEQPGTPNPVHVVFRRDADAFFDGLLPEHQAEVRRILLELVRVDRLLEPYRQPVLLSHLLLGAAVPERALVALEKMGRKGFVRTVPPEGGPNAVVEVRHEALLRNWPRYADWIDEKREGARRRVALTDAAQRWSTSADRSQGLLTESQLAELQGLSELSDLERAYCQASRDAVDQARRLHDTRIRQQERRKRNWALGLTAAIAAVAVIGAVSVNRVQRSVLARTLETYHWMDSARNAMAQGRLDHAFEAVPQMASGADELARLDPEALDIRFLERKTLLSIIRGADDVRRLFVAPQSVLQAVAFQPGRGDALVAYAGSGGQVHLAALDASPAGGEPMGRSLPACSQALVTALVFDPNGRWLAAGCADGTLAIWSTSDWAPRGRFEHVFNGRTIWTLAAHPSGRLLALGGYDNRVLLVTLAEDGTPESAAPGEAGGPDQPLGYVWSLAFAPNDDLLLVGDGVGSVLVCRGQPMPSWACRKSTAFPGARDKEAEATDAIRALAFAPNGSFVAIGRWNGGVDLADVNVTVKRKPPLDVDEIPGPVHSLAFQQACDRLQLAIGKGSGLLYRAVAPLDEPEPGALYCRTRASLGDEVYSIAAHAPSGRLAAVTRSGYLAVIAPPGTTDDPLRRSVHAPATSQESAMRAAVVGTEGSVTRIVVRSEDVAARRTQLTLLTLVEGRVSETPPVALADFEGRGVRLAGHAGRRLLAVLRPGPTPEVTVQALDDRFTALQPPALVLGPEQFDHRSPTRVAFSPDGKWLVLAFAPTPASAPGEPVPSTPLLQVSVDRAQPDRWIPTALRGSIEIAFSADGKTFAAGGEAVQAQTGAGAGQVRWWQVMREGLEAVNHPPMRLGSQANKVYEVAFAADAKGRPLLLAGGQYGVIERWRVDTAERLEPLRADSRPVLQIAYSPAASLIAAADSLNVVRIWDALAGEPMALTRLEDRVDHPGVIAFGGNGAWLLSADKSTVKVWDLDIDRLRDKACALLRKPGQHGADPSRQSGQMGPCALP